MIYQIINDLPKDFGDPVVLAYCANYKLAEILLTNIKGIQQDSYSQQYVKIKKVYGFIGDLKVSKTKLVVMKVKEKNG